MTGRGGVRAGRGDQRAHEAFPRRPNAVDHIDLAVPRGSVYGFLGPNGSGKTTTIRMLLGLVFPTSGHAELLGAPMPAGAVRVLPYVGSLIEGPAFYPFLTGRDNLVRCDAADRTADPRTAAGRISAALERVGLLAAARKRYRHYSLGMKQRLAIAAGLLIPRELIVLDEPTNGLDPQGTREVRGLIRQIAADGITVFVSSHLLAEVGQVCSHVGVMRTGRLVFQGPLEELRARGAARIRVERPSPPRPRRYSNGSASPTRGWPGTRCQRSSRVVSPSGSARSSSGQVSGSAGSAWSRRAWRTCSWSSPERGSISMAESLVAGSPAPGSLTAPAQAGAGYAGGTAVAGRAAMPPSARGCVSSGRSCAWSSAAAGTRRCWWWSGCFPSSSASGCASTAAEQHRRPQRGVHHQLAGNGVFLSFIALTLLLILVMPLAVAVVAGDSMAATPATARCARCWRSRPGGSACSP